jgi:hypothetical protein
MIFLEGVVLYHVIYVLICAIILYTIRQGGGDWQQGWFWAILGFFPILYFTWPLIIVALPFVLVHELFKRAKKLFKKKRHDKS